MRRGVVVGLGVLVAVAGLRALADRTAVAHGIPGRVSEPIVVRGSDLAPFTGAREQHLWAWAFDHGSWEITRVQMDERNDDGDIVAEEDDALDAKDEVVLMADLVGARRGPDDWPPGIDRSYPAAEVRITDPLDDEYEGFVYLFRSASGPEIALAPLVRWNPETREITADAYALGLADLENDGFTGVRSLRLFAGSGDVVDRLKIRATLEAFGVKTTYDEEDGQLAVDPVAPVAQGRVRLVLNAAGTAVAYARRVRLPNPIEDVDLDLLPGVLDFERGRVSLDFAPSAGQGSYLDANLAAPVDVDGMADEVPATPWSPWRSIEFLDGKLVLLGAGVAELENYYSDGEDVSGDTGDDVSYGDAGMVSTSLDALAEGAFPGEMVMVAPGQEIEAPDLWAQQTNPLNWSVALVPAPTPTGPSPTPEPTATGPTATGTATAEPSRTSGATASATPTDDGSTEHTVYAPYAHRP